MQSHDGVASSSWLGDLGVGWRAVHLVNDPKPGSSHGMRNELTSRKLLAEEEKKGLSWERNVSISQKEVSLCMISNPCIEVQTTRENRFSVPAWFRSRGDHCWLSGEERAA
jgi:hypothetical protein